MEGMSIIRPLDWTRHRYVGVSKVIITPHLK